jgi:lipoprotein-anchoring transpeptidase ErfK/SrfK
MKKVVKRFFSPEKWWEFTLLGVFFLGVIHTWIFFWHQFLVYRYDVLYDEATREGTLVEMPVEFQKTHINANTLNFITRTDTIIHDAIILQSGIRSLINQYRNDLYRMHDTIVQNIQSLRTLVEVSEEIVFPERDEIRTRIDYLETQLASDRETRTESLETLMQTSNEYLLKATADLERTKKTLVLQDIQSLDHEFTFLDSIYRVNRDTALSFDPKILKKIYTESFTEEKLATQTSEQLQESLTTLSNLLDPYRIESRDIRKIAREKRADIVAKEAEKWVESTPPEAPFFDIYDQIYVSLKDQKMYVYEDGDLILSTPITSGRQNFETVRGTFKVYTKQRNKLMKSPFPDEEYELWVDYWLGFYGAYGIHDACNSTDCWRTKFGGASYVYNGSHGCINTPYNAVRFIYNWAKIGTTVHVK